MHVPEFSRKHCCFCGALTLYSRIPASLKGEEADREHGDSKNKVTTRTGAPAELRSSQGVGRTFSRDRQGIQRQEGRQEIRKLKCAFLEKPTILEIWVSHSLAQKLLVVVVNPFLIILQETYHHGPYLHLLFLCLQAVKLFISA